MINVGTVVMKFVAYVQGKNKISTNLTYVVRNAVEMY